MRNRIMAALAGLVLALGLSAAVAAPAQADISQCANGQICIWTGTLQTGSFAEYQSSTIYQASGHCWKFAAGTFNNSISSSASKWVINGFRVTYYDNNVCTGTSIHYDSQPYALGSFPSGWDNRIGSISVTMI